MAREWRHFADDILAAIDGIETALRGKSLEDLQSEWLLKLAIQRAMEIISEASRRLPDSIKAHAPNIAWRKISGMGNVLRHEYFAVSDTIIWDTIAIDLPDLKRAMNEIMTKSEG